MAVYRFYGSVVKDMEEDCHLVLPKTNRNTKPARKEYLHSGCAVAIVQTLLQEAPPRTDEHCQEMVDLLCQFLGHESVDAAAAWQDRMDAMVRLQLSIGML